MYNFLFTSTHVFIRPDHFFRPQNYLVKFADTANLSDKPTKKKQTRLAALMTKRSSFQWIIIQPKNCVCGGGGGTFYTMSPTFHIMGRTRPHPPGSPPMHVLKRSIPVNYDFVTYRYCVRSKMYGKSRSHFVLVLHIGFCQNTSDIIFYFKVMLPVDRIVMIVAVTWVTSFQETEFAPQVHISIKGTG